MEIPTILQQLGRSQAANPMMEMIKQAKSVLGSMKNPEAMLNQLMQSNPMVNQVIRQYGSVDGAITALCRQKGINPQEFIDALK